MIVMVYEERGRKEGRYSPHNVEETRKRIRSVNDSKENLQRNLGYEGVTAIEEGSVHETHLRQPTTLLIINLLRFLRNRSPTMHHRTNCVPRRIRTR